MSSQLFGSFRDLAAQYLDGGPAAPLLTSETLAGAGALVLVAERQAADVATRAIAGVIFLARAQHLQNRPSEADFHAAFFLFSAAYAEEPRLVPEPLRSQFKALPPQLPLPHEIPHAVGAALNDEYHLSSSEPQLLDLAVLLFQRAAAVMSAGHADERVIQSNLGCALYKRFEEKRSEDDLVASVVALQRAFEAGAAELVVCQRLWSKLAKALKARFELLGDREDLDDAMHAYRKAIDALAPGNTPEPADVVIWFELGALAWKRYGLRKDPRDLEQAIAAFRTTVAHIASDHPARAGNHSALANALLERYKLSRDRNDIDEAVNASIAAVAACPLNAPIRAALQSNLAAMRTLQAEGAAFDRTT